jgi:Calcium-activated potassium channel slowpoke-like RCK domain/Ion channel
LIVQASTWIPSVQSFHDTLFYVVLTLATIGYPDTNNGWGRMLLIAFIFCLTLIIPPALSNLVDLMAQTSKYAGSLNARKARNHVVVFCGDLRYGISDVVHLVSELFHEDHGAARPETIVLVAPCEPPADLQAMILSPEFKHRVVFLKGSGMSAVDTRRARVEQARACFVLTTKSGTHEQDAATAMKTLRLNSNIDIPTFAEVLDPKSVKIVRQAGANHVVCIGQVSMSLLAHSVYTPGFTTFMTVCCVLLVHRTPSVLPVIFQALSYSRSHCFMREKGCGLTRADHRSRISAELLSRSLKRRKHRKTFSCINTALGPSYTKLLCRHVFTGSPSARPLGVCFEIPVRP